MKFLIIISLLFSGLSLAQAQNNCSESSENNCTIGRAGNRQAVIVNDGIVETYPSLELAIEAFTMLNNAGVCGLYSELATCTITLEGNRQAVLVNGSVVETYPSLVLAVEAFVNLTDAGVCTDASNPYE